MFFMFELICVMFYFPQITLIIAESTPKHLRRSALSGGTTSTIFSKAPADFADYRRYLKEPFANYLRRSVFSGGTTSTIFGRAPADFADYRGYLKRPFAKYLRPSALSAGITDACLVELPLISLIFADI